MEERALLDMIYKGVFALVLFHAAALMFWVYCVFKGEDGSLRKTDKLH